MTSATAIPGCSPATTFWLRWPAGELPSTLLAWRVIGGVVDCCNLDSDQFDRESATTQAQRYREKGLDRLAAIIVRAVSARKKEMGRVLEIGGGVGALSLELIKAGATSAVNVELSRSYRDAARALALEAGLEDRLELVDADGAAVARGMGPFGTVIMNRVVCCYPDGDELMRAAADAASGLLAVSYPAIHAGSRAFIGVENWIRNRRGSEFRAFVHPNSTFNAPEASGFREVFRRRRPIWSLRVWERPVAA